MKSKIFKYCLFFLTLEVMAAENTNFTSQNCNGVDLTKYGYTLELTYCSYSASDMGRYWSIKDGFFTKPSNEKNTYTESIAKKNDYLWCGIVSADTIKSFGGDAACFEAHTYWKKNTSSNEVLTKNEIDAIKEEQKIACQKDPASCGIKISSCENAIEACVISKKYLDSLPNGWNLVGTGEKISDYSILNGISSVWLYKNNKWIKYIPTNNTLIPPNAEIDKFDGFWIKK